MFLRTNNCQLIYIYLFAIASLAIGNPALAIDPNSNLPIQIESDRATLNDETGISNYSGNVIISQGLSRLEADNISVNALNRKIVSIKATGEPAHFTQQDAATSPSTHGYGKTIVYIAKESILKFLGEARLVQEDNSFAGEQIEYDIMRKAIKAQGDETIGSRVKIQYNPNTNIKNQTPPTLNKLDEVNNENP